MQINIHLKSPCSCLHSQLHGIQHRNYLWPMECMWLSNMNKSRFISNQIKKLCYEVWLKRVGKKISCWSASWEAHTIAKKSSPYSLKLEKVCAQQQRPSTIKNTYNKNKKWGPSWWHSGWESSCQCRGHRFNPWSWRVPRTPCATATEPTCYSNWRLHA